MIYLTEALFASVDSSGMVGVHRVGVSDSSEAQDPVMIPPASAPRDFPMCGWAGLTFSSAEPHTLATVSGSRMLWQQA
jgi:hypothetical protein